MYLGRKRCFFDVSIGGGPSDPGSVLVSREDKGKPQNAEMIGEIWGKPPPPNKTSLLLD